MREYKGEPIDGTVQHLSDVEVPGDSSAQGNVKTEISAETELQEKIHELKMLNPNSSLRDIANELDCSFVYVKSTLDGDVGGKYSRYRKESWEDYTDTEKKIIKYHKSNMFGTKREVADKIGVSLAYVTKVTKANSHLFSGD